MFKRIISVFIAVLMIISLIPINIAYAAPSVKDMNKPSWITMVTDKYRYIVVAYNFGGYKQTPDSNGPIYDNPTNEGFNTGN